MMLPLAKMFFAAMFLFNAVPHLVRGICGKQHMTPLSPRSSALVNVLWGWINLGLGVWLYRCAAASVWSTAGCVAFVSGGLTISVFLALFWSNPAARLPWHKKG